MGFFGRTLAGAAGGAIIGGTTTQSWGGAGYGAAFGAGTAGMGPMVGRRIMAGRTGPVGIAASGLGMLGDAALRGTSRLGNRTLFNAARGMDRGLTQAAAFLGKNQVFINKYGGAALLGLGTAASAHIGSSVLASNRGY
jgi:hypothetical protein